MEFKFRAIDVNNKPPPTGEAALRRELETEQIRRKILPPRELEEEMRRKLAMEKELWISIPRPLMNVQGLEPPSILPPSEICHSPEICDEGKVIVLDKPDPDLFNAKRKATAPPGSENEPFAFSLKKKPKKEWSCALCEIRATNESGLNAHLNGKKHRAREARQNRKIAERNSNCGENVKATQTVVATTELGADAEKDQQLLQPCPALEAMNETVVDKGVEESEKEEQLVKTVADNDTSAAESKNEKFVALMVGKNITESKIEEQLGETVADKGVEESKKEEQLVKTVADNDTSATKSKNEKFVVTTVGKNESESKNEEQLVETVADNGVSVIKSTNVNKLVEMMVSNDVVKFENGVLLVEKSQNVGSLESKKDAAIEEAEKISALSKRRKVEPLWCEICQISTHSKVMMEGHIKGKKHIKKMKFEQNNASPPSTLSASQKAPMIKDT